MATEAPILDSNGIMTVEGIRRFLPDKQSHPLATKIRENLPRNLKEVAINGAVGLAAGSVARIALAGTGVGWVGAIAGGMAVGAAVEAFREHRSSGSIDAKKVGIAALKGGASGLIGFGVLEALSQTGIGSAVGSVISEKFSGLGCNFHNSASSAADIVDAVVFESKISPYAPDYCNDLLTGIELPAATQSLPEEIGLLTGLGLPEIPNPISLAQEKWQEVSTAFAPAEAQTAHITPPTERVINIPTVVDLPNTLAHIDPNLTAGLNYTERFFLQYDPEFGNSSGVDGLAAAEITKFLEGMEDWDPFTGEGEQLFKDRIENHQDYGYLLEEYKLAVWTRNPLDFFEDSGSRIKHFLDGGLHTPDGPEGNLMALKLLEGEERNKFFRAALQRRLYVG